MRQDQYEKLQGLEEKLTAVFLDEVEPKKWPGHGIEPRAMDQQTRGDRYWCKRNAVATLSLIQRVGALVGQVQLRGAGTTPPAETGEGEEVDHLDAEVKAAEKEAARLMRELQGGAKGKFTTRKVHGRASG